MGLLDDAIREHLELKRRHGADPDEVQRQEREALGAAPQRAEFAQPGDADADVVEGGETPEPPGQEPPPEPPVPDPDEEDPWEVEDLADPPGRDEPDEPDEQPGAVAASEEGAPGAGGDEEPADELEATPEFLQETPEHERLWFEQKPPRDFDWDK
jgi:hypothetical protein